MNVRSSLFKIYWKIEKVLAPKLKYSQSIYEEVLKSHVSPHMVWLDLGCGHNILPEWRREQEKDLLRNCKMVVGLDADLPSLRKHKGISLKVAGDIGELPFRSSFFDLVTANMVVEHLDCPAVQFAEVNRILLTGGLFILHTPNALGYTTLMTRIVPSRLKPKLAYLIEGRAEEDVFETFYQANTGERIHDLARAAGFDVVEIKMIVSSAEFVIIIPLAILELLWIRLLMTKMLRPFRTNIIAVLRKR